VLARQCFTELAHQSAETSPTNASTAAANTGVASASDSKELTIRTDSALHRDQSASWDDAQRLVLELVFAQLDQQVTAFAQVRFESRSHRLLMLSAG